ncbi:hypothetical protein P8935_20250 [Telmatobacter sp. DSM 110680]|uniref:DUF1579 domain-containing protein n=1 Tax=Telmatobacter sp. DSM 110680 TaxID=3036704 RepID=A0AAU7DGF5_9BACT
MTFRPHRLALLFVLFTYLGALDARTPSAQPAAASASLQSLIQALSGNWQLKVHLAAMEPGSKAIDGAGEESWAAGPGNITLIEQEHVPMPAGYSFLMGIIWWDNKANHFGGMECNSQLPFTCDLKGALNDITVSWDGKKFQIDEIETHGDKHYVWHESWSNITANSFEQNGDVTLPDGSSQRFMTVQATRVQKLQSLGAR